MTCLTPGSCQARRDAEARLPQERPTENHPSRPSPHE
jgi:hypothetical protein